MPFRNYNSDHIFATFLLPNNQKQKQKNNMIKNNLCLGPEWGVEITCLSITAVSHGAAA